MRYSYRFNPKRGEQGYTPGGSWLTYAEALTVLMDRVMKEYAPKEWMFAGSGDSLKVIKTTVSTQVLIGEITVHDDEYERLRSLKEELEVEIEEDQQKLAKVEQKLKELEGKSSYPPSQDSAVNED